MRESRTQHRRRSKNKPTRKPSRVHIPRSYAWDVLANVLKDVGEQLSESDQAHIHKIVRSRDMQAYLDLSLGWGLQCMPDQPSLADEAKLLLCSVIKKYPLREGGFDRRGAALEKMREAEAQCSLFNRKHWKTLLHADGRPTRELALMREFCSRTLGHFVPEDITEEGRHGPGSDTVLAFRDSSVYFKYADWPYRCTAGSREYAKLLIRSDERWLGALEDDVRSKYGIEKYQILDQAAFWDTVLVACDDNRVTTVPKSVSIDRPIAIENRINIYLQLGVDGYIRRRLKRWGINIDSQEKNQKLACLGSLDLGQDSPCTIDLANASDTVSLRIARELLPRAWFEYLCSLRSPKGVLPDGQRVRYSKLSSMGNGYTFAIETLIFSAAVYACCIQGYGKWMPDLIAVYGDDIVVPKYIYPRAAHLLKHCGFTLNSDKSFSQGAIRESCGSDWVSGRPVRVPTIHNEPTFDVELLAHRNKLFRWMSLNGIPSTHVDQYYNRYLQHVPRGPMTDTVMWTTDMYADVLPMKQLFSQENSGSWWHTPDVGSFGGECQAYYVTSLALRYSVSKASRNFLFRKLMAPLRCRVKHERFTFDERVPTNGSVFDVLSKHKLRQVVSTRLLPNWQSAYSR